jgi:arylsulfatase
MSEDQKDVLIAAYLIEDLAKRDFDAVVKLAEDKTITVEGSCWSRRTADGEVQVTETGDHLGRKGAKVGGGVGLVVGLFAPPLLAATAVGASPAA